jgi:hypothetical protein
MKVVVTKGDIERARELYSMIELGKLSYESCCPVAKALERMGYAAFVCTESVNFGDGVEVVMPQKAIDWIARYDRKNPNVRPFSFELNY